jgi:phosphoribosylaminoimidazolecarboxamide formyltransferase/IMP cyclohydrolase
MSRRALISVYDKRGLDEFARGLAELGFEIVASGGTAKHIADLGIDVIEVGDVTQHPEMLGGRVKTLHPRIHGGILARLDRDDDRSALEEHGIEPFEIVCVNLYPFRDVTSRFGVKEEEAVEMIDIGGPAMLRAAAKNFAHVAAVASPDLYPLVLAQLREHGVVTLEARRRLATAAFAETALYEAAIAGWFADRESFPSSFIPGFGKVLDLTYGENPHQRAAFYAEQGARVHLLSQVEQLHGRDLSFNNLNDLNAARMLVREFSIPACVIVKHANPCGVAAAATIEEAYEKALLADPLSAYGGVIALNRPVSLELGMMLSGQFVEVVIAPGYDETGLEMLKQKPSVRILDDQERRRVGAGERDYKRVLGGLLVQDRDVEIQDRDEMNVVTGKPDERLWGDMLFAWRACKHVTSNAIVLAKNLQTIGIGAGQMSRVDSVRIAVAKAQEHGHDLRGAVLASDAFFPFDDGPKIALEAGVAAVIQPGGSKRDSEVIATVRMHNAAMVFTHRRHFRH